jgi:hypothetical protein
MSDFLRSSTSQKARKQHRCIACYGVIAQGEFYKQQTGVWDDKAFRNKFHNECYTALCEDGEDYEFSPGSFDYPERLKGI